MVVARPSVQRGVVRHWASGRRGDAVSARRHARLASTRAPSVFETRHEDRVRDLCRIVLCSRVVRQIVPLTQQTHAYAHTHTHTHTRTRTHTHTHTRIRNTRSRYVLQTRRSRIVRVSRSWHSGVFVRFSTNIANTPSKIAVFRFA